MASYRFCRTDDVPLLVDAYNRCYRVHLGGLPEMTVDEFRRAVRELDLWCSSCMLATAAGAAIAVLLAAKRETENLVHVIGVHPEHLRRGHGRHLVASLGAKLSILGPRRITAEVPADWAGVCAFFEACGFRRERSYADFERQPDPGPFDARGIIVPVTIDDLLAGGILDPDAPRCWERAPRCLMKVRDRVRGIALAADTLEAYVLYRDAGAGAPREILALGCADEGRREVLLGLLIRQLGAAGPAPVRISRAWSGEIPFELLERWGFRRARAYAGYTAEAGAVLN